MTWSRRNIKIAALVAAAPSVAMLIVFAVGESVGGDLSGLGHLVQLLPLVLVLLVAWRYPRPGGIVLLAIGVGLAAVFPLLAREARFDLATILLAGTVFFAPPLVSGVLFLVAARADRTTHPA